MASCEESERPNFTLIWTLEKVTRWTHFSLTSPSFVADTIDNGRWCLVLWERNGNILCRPCKTHNESGPDSVEIEYETAIVTFRGSVFNSKRQKKCFEAENVFSVRSSVGDGETVLLEENDKLNLDGTLTIRCRMWKAGNESSKSNLCFAHTRLKQERRYFTWKIPEFSSLLTGQRRSFYLQVTPRGNLYHVLDLYLQSDDDEDKICIEKPKGFPFDFFCGVSVVDATGNVVCSTLIADNGALISLLKLMSNKSLYLPEDVLHLRCACEIEFGKVSHRIENYEQLPTPTDKHDIGTAAMNDDRTEESSCCPSYCSLKKAVKKYYENREFTDINLRVGNESFPAHKIILSAKSKVFKEMFTKDPSKKGRKSVELTGDIDSDILRRLLFYMYSEVIEGLTPEVAMKLYKAAIKYDMQDLKEKCSKFLGSSISVANIFAILTFADKQRDEQLKNEACFFIFEHDAEMFSSVDWKRFNKKYPMLAEQVMQRTYQMNVIASIVQYKILQGLVSTDD